MTKSARLMLAVALALLVVTGVWLYVERKLANPPYQPLAVSALEKDDVPHPPHEPAQIAFAEPNMSSAERVAFLAGDYEILRSVTELPKGVVKDFTAKDEKRIAMADPGQRFQETDVAVDETLPRRRLIFAGVFGDRVFIHYEEGGIGKAYVVDFFRLQTPEIAAGVWHGFCNRPGRDLGDIRQRISDGRCHR